MPTLQSTAVVAVAGTGASANLVATSAGKSIRVWQLLVTGTTTDTASIVFTQAGTATTIKVAVTNGTTTLPYTGTPWAVADVGTGITFTAAATTTLSAYYTQAIGG